MFGIRGSAEPKQHLQAATAHAIAGPSTIQLPSWNLVVYCVHSFAVALVLWDDNQVQLHTWYAASLDVRMCHLHCFCSDHNQQVC